MRSAGYARSNERERMASRYLTVLVIVASCALAATVGAPAAEARNLVLFIPEALSSAAVDPSNAPVLARLRSEGVNFTNSHSGYPRLMAVDESGAASELNGNESDLDAKALFDAAQRRYAT